MLTRNWPNALAGTNLPVVSDTWFGRMLIVYRPLSARSQVPPGGVIRYVTTIRPASRAGLIEATAALARYLRGPVTWMSLLLIVEYFTLSLSTYVTVNE